MAKFFLKKYDFKSHPTQSQRIGIFWLSVILLVIAGAIIFIPHKAAKSVSEMDAMISDTTILAEKEQTAYQSRRQYIRSRRHKSENAGKASSWKTETTATTATTTYDTMRPARRQQLMVELNEADTISLQMLYGIGPTRARRIVEYREKLGGYREVRQLLEVYGISAELLGEIAPHLVIDTTDIRKIDINSVTIKQLIRHPYIEYNQARDIVRLRSKGIHFATADDLRAVPSMADTTLKRLLPYIEFGVTGDATE